MQPVVPEKHVTFDEPSQGPPLGSSSRPDHSSTSTPARLPSTGSPASTLEGSKEVGTSGGAETAVTPSNEPKGGWHQEEEEYLEENMADLSMREERARVESGQKVLYDPDSPSPDPSRSSVTSLSQDRADASAARARAGRKTVSGGRRLTGVEFDLFDTPQPKSANRADRRA